MKIAELFVALGLEGTDKVVKGLKSVNDSFKEATSSSFTMKALMAGAVVGMERMVKAASSTGMELYQFAKATGLSSVELQKWQYMMGQYGAGEETQAALETIQELLASIKMGGNVPAAWGLLNLPTAGKNAIQILEMLEKKSKAFTDPSVGVSLFKQLGLSSKAFQALRSINMEKDRMDKRLIISDKERDNLMQINREWYNFWANLQRIGTKLTGDYGSVFIGSLKNVVKVLPEAVGWVKKLMEQFDALKVVIPVIGAAIAYHFAPLLTIIAGIGFLLNEIEKYRKGEEGILSDILNPMGKKEKPETAKGMAKEAAITMADVAATAMNNFNEMIGWNYKMPTIREAQADKQAQAIMNNSRPIINRPSSSNQVTNNTNATTSTQNIYLDGQNISSKFSDPFKKELSSVLNFSAARVPK